MLIRYRENGGTKLKDEDEEDATAEPKVGGSKYDILLFLQLLFPCHRERTVLPQTRSKDIFLGFNQSQGRGPGN